MIKKVSMLFLALTLTFGLSSCYTTTHTVGSGAKSGVSTSATQWYAVFGLLPINQADSKSLAGGATDYTIKTQHTFLDQVISTFTGIVTISRQTVTVTK